MFEVWLSVDFQLRQQFQKVRDLVDGARVILIATHEKPDGDGVGSSLALGQIFGETGKKFLYFCPDALPDYFKLLPRSENFVSKLPEEHFSLIFALDYGKYARLGQLSRTDQIDEGKIISIDHHPMQDQKGRIKIILPEFSSTAEIVYELAKSLKLPISRNAAFYLLTGIFTDTGGFKHAVTSPQTLRIAGDLISMGVNLAEIAKIFSFQTSLQSLNIRGLILSRTRHDRDTGIVYCWVSRDDFEVFPAGFSDIDGLPEVINSISGCRLAVFMSEDKRGEIYCSLRSQPFMNLNVAKIAENFGGGGHPYAAGFRFRGTLKEALESVKRVVREVV